MKQTLDEATSAVLEAADLILKMKAEGVSQELKEDNSPVTDADRKAEALIRKRLLTAFPGYGFIGEEFKDTASQNGLYWTCDPIDGTWSYLNGESTCTTSLSLMKDDETLLAVIYNPFTRELFQGASGIPGTWNTLPMPLVFKKDLEDSVVNFFVHRSRLEDVMTLYQLREKKVINKMVSMGGSVAYALAMVAKGAHNVFIGLSSRKSNIWDMSAGIFLVRSVGGLVTDLTGNDIGPETRPFSPIIASSHPHIHDEILEVLNGVNFAS
ncbi:MAG: inositol monophosphatase [Bacteroidota bacterium]